MAAAFVSASMLSVAYRHTGAPAVFHGRPRWPAGVWRLRPPLPAAARRRRRRHDAPMPWATPCAFPVPPAPLLATVVATVAATHTAAAAAADAAVWVTAAVRQQIAAALPAASLVAATAAAAAGHLLVPALCVIAPRLLLRVLYVGTVAVRRFVAVPLGAVAAAAPPAAAATRAAVAPSDSAVATTVPADTDVATTVLSDAAVTADAAADYAAAAGDAPISVRNAYEQSILPMLEGVVSGYGILRATHVTAAAVTALMTGVGGGGLGLGVAAAAGRGGASAAMATRGVLPRVARLAYTLFVGVALSTAKGAALARSAAGQGIFRSPRHRFLLNRAGDVAIVGILAGAAAEAAGVPLRSALAVGGFGGIALGLASRQAAENLLGGVVLGVTSTFVPGDKVRVRRGGSGGGSVEGTVSVVGPIRSVLIGWDGVPTSVPNSFFTAALITNLSRMASRRFRQHLPLRAADMAAVPAVVTALRRRLDADPAVEGNRGGVYLRAFGRRSVDVEVTVYFRGLTRGEYRQAVQQLLLDIHAVMTAHGAALVTVCHCEVCLRD